MDIIVHKYDNTIFEKQRLKKFAKKLYSKESLNNLYYLNPKYSQINKYKNKDIKQGPKYFGSTTFLVQTTDLQHLSQSVFLNFLFFGNAILFYSIAYLSFQKILIIIILTKILYTIVFELFYSKILFQKNEKRN